MAIETSEQEKVNNYISQFLNTGNQIHNYWIHPKSNNFGIVFNGWQRIHMIIESGQTEMAFNTCALQNDVPNDIRELTVPLIRKVFPTLMKKVIRSRERVRLFSFP